LSPKGDANFRKKKPVSTGALKKQKENREALRFTADDIVRAFEAVEQAGLTVHAVDIAPDGSMSIKTTSPFKRGAAPKTEASADAQDEVQPNKKRA
jgi:hypothetical protein